MAAGAEAEEEVAVQRTMDLSWRATMTGACIHTRDVCCMLMPKEPYVPFLF
jgi:hypothetical protein